MPRAKPARVRPAIAKISCPRPRPVFLRTRLLAWLDAAAADTSVLWIQGPPGAGKTTLAVNWVSERAQRVLWYQVDAADRDVATFFHFLGLALARAAPRYRTPLPKLASEYRAGLPTFARNFFRELARRLKPPFVLVLDNVQEAGADAALYEVLREGLEELPPGACALLISRARPPEALARWQLDERLKLLDWPALRLTEEEAGPFAALAFPDRSFDTVVFSIALCAIPDPRRAPLRPEERTATLWRAMRFLEKRSPLTPRGFGPRSPICYSRLSVLRIPETVSSPPNG